MEHKAINGRALLEKLRSDGHINLVVERLQNTFILVVGDDPKWLHVLEKGLNVDGELLRFTHMAAADGPLRESIPLAAADEEQVVENVVARDIGIVFADGRLYNAALPLIRLPRRLL